VAAELAGRILRGTMRRIADGEEYTTSTTIDDLAILAEISRELEQIGKAGTIVVHSKRQGRHLQVGRPSTRHRATRRPLLLRRAVVGVGLRLGLSPARGP
jgi:hypothetical protein